MFKEVVIVLSDDMDFDKFVEKCRRKCRVRRRSERSQLLAKGYVAGVEDTLRMLKEELDKTKRKNNNLSTENKEYYL